MGLSAGIAEAETPPGGPNTWCPGDPPVATGNIRVNPVIWDNNICHEYWYVYHGQGNVAQNIWDGPNPPGPPPGQGSSLRRPFRRAGAGASSCRRRARSNSHVEPTLRTRSTNRPSRVVGRARRPPAAGCMSWRRRPVRCARGAFGRICSAVTRAQKRGAFGRRRSPG